MRCDDVIRVLGPIDLLTSEGARSVGGRKERRLLGALVIGAGRSVSADHLQWSLWGDAPPRSAESSLQTYIARLRQLLGHDAIVRSDHCYRLAVERTQIDAIHFEDLLLTAPAPREDPQRCREVCAEGLALWRGDPFGDFVDDEPFRLESSRLYELRVSMLEHALESELVLGHADVVAAELESAVEEYPYRERLWHLLIEALMRDDRRVEALRACHRLRDTLAATGLAPDDTLTRLEEEILTADHTSRDASEHRQRRPLPSRDRPPLPDQ
jgi:DNA-binding SARP family transcriptional activator